MMLYKDTKAMAHLLDGYTDLTLSLETCKEIKTIYDYNLLRLYTVNVNRYNERNGFTLKIARSRWYSTETITDADNTDDLMFLANASAQAEFLLHSLEQATEGIGLYVISDKTELMCFKQDDAISW